jgi:hypothetical protein
MREAQVSARLRTIGRDLQSRLKDFFDSPIGDDAAPIELLEAAVDRLERKVQPAGRGRRIFPYDRITVHVAQRNADVPAIEAVFAQLEDRLRNRLGEMSCDAPDVLDVQCVVGSAEGDEAIPVLTVECDRTAEIRNPPSRPGTRPALSITVLKGQCELPEYHFDQPVISIGRTPEPSDAFGLVRRNHVAFLDVRDGTTETVGRAHARLEFDAASGHYLLFNESSSNPTSIIRGGEPIRVAPRDPRGVRVRSGDQILLGRAVLAVSTGVGS